LAGYDEPLNHAIYMQRFYFDHNATTPVDPEVLSSFVEIQASSFGNASSIHQEGQRARQLLEQARRGLAARLSESGSASSSASVDPNEIVFTGGGTEANNLAILGLVRSLATNMGTASKHVITTNLEHPAVLEACRQLEREGVEITRVRSDARGCVRAEDIAAAIRPETVLVSVMHANNETGVIQPLADIATFVQERRTTERTIYFHSDGVQAFGKTPVDVRELGVDLYAISAHKVYAPKGTGALWVKKGVPLRGISFGGRHERERRAGTENVAGAVAFAAAAGLVDESARKRLAGLRDLFESQLAAIPDVRVNGTGQRLTNTSNVLFPHLSGESIVIALDLKGFAASSGSACSSGSVEPSPALLAMGLTSEEARSSVRFSLGRGNDEEQVQKLTDAIQSVVRQVRSTKHVTKAAALPEPHEVASASR
jgi:cysteine desulfurase